MENGLNKELERLRFLTGNYTLLQGYPMALGGLICLVWGASLMTWGLPVADLIYGWLLFPSVAFLYIGALIITRLQQRRYGSVKPAPMSDRRTFSLIAFAIVYFIVARLAGPGFKNLKVTLEPTLLNGGLILVLLGLLPTFPWRHYVAVGLPAMAVSFLPALHIAALQRWHGWGVMGVGIAFLLCGAIDRLVLLRHLPPQAKASHA